MADVTLRPMDAEGFEQWLSELAGAFAREQVAAGLYAETEALAKAHEMHAALLPQGIATPGMLFLEGELADGTGVGRLWIGLRHPRGAPGCAFLYDIEVAAEHRGRGLGRALLTAGETAARDAGAQALELNVFGSNATAISLYSTAGYQVTTQQMRKILR